MRRSSYVNVATFRAYPRRTLTHTLPIPSLPVCPIDWAANWEYHLSMSAKSLYQGTAQLAGEGRPPLAVENARTPAT